jgi:hypothetical protein
MSAANDDSNTRFWGMGLDMNIDAISSLVYPFRFRALAV